MKPTLRISPTILNEFASYKNGDYEAWGKTQEDFRQYVLGERSPNVYFSRGIAVHSVMEGIEAAELGQIHEPELGVTWQFTGDVIKAIRDYAAQFEKAAHEVPNLHWIETPDADVCMNMRFDCLDVMHLHEFKTSSKPKAYKDYYTSLQWRCYLMALPEINNVTYHIIQFPHAEPTKILEKVSIYKHEYRREANNDEIVMSYLNELIAWVLDDNELRGKLSVNFKELERRMAEVVQCMLDGKENPSTGRETLFKLAGDYEQLHPFLRKCLNEVKGLR